MVKRDQEKIDDEGPSKNEKVKALVWSGVVTALIMYYLLTSMK